MLRLSGIRGDRHRRESRIIELMSARYSREGDSLGAIYEVFKAKKRAEVAPGSWARHRYDLRRQRSLLVLVPEFDDKKVLEQLAPHIDMSAKRRKERLS